jgi:hypothetical protein
MMFQEIHLDDRMTTDSHICNGSGTTNTIVSSLYETKTAKVNDEKQKEETNTKQKKHFLLLCESCFWCASSIYIDGNINRICPVCNNINVESIPIQNNELYKFDYDQRLGISFEFSELVV